MEQNASACRETRRERGGGNIYIISEPSAASRTITLLDQPSLLSFITLETSCFFLPTALALIARAPPRKNPFTEDLGVNLAIVPSLSRTSSAPCEK